jgi:dTMP kinase
MIGRLITLEGGEGAGKSTVLATVRDLLAERGCEVIVTREPGGTPAGEAIRNILLDPSYRGLSAETELLLMFAARAQLVHAVIQPTLAAGRWVLSDRFTDASYAYQGGGRGQPEVRIAELERWAAAGTTPDLTLLLDLPVADGMKRVLRRSSGQAAGRVAADRIEMENADFFERVRASYRARAAAAPARFRVIDASAPLDAVLAEVRRVVAAFVDAAGART